MRSPFKFLDSYTKDDREIFFGRDREIEELYHRVFESRIMLVYGVSGTGKSSLIHCGLANKFRETDWLPLVIRRGGNIIDSMAAALKSASITKQSNLINPADFKKGVRSLYLDHYKPVFFIFDQFEELFIFGNREERRLFINIVKTLTDSDLQCRMIFVMREEYMAAVTEFEKFIPIFFSNRVRIEKMSHLNALDAIKGPCKVFNISLEEGFAESLLEKLSPESEEVELTYMQVFLDKIFRLATSNIPPFRGGQGGSAESKGELSFTLALLEKTGNVSDLLGSFLDEQLSLLDDPEAALTVLKSFVSVKGTKQPMKPEDVLEYSKTLGRVIEESYLTDLVRNFVNLRILNDKDQKGYYELRHDALAAKIYEKFTLAEKELLEVRRFVENAYYSYESRGITLSKNDLDYLENYENQLLLPEKLNEFVYNSKEKISEQRRSLRRITRISTLIFVIILAIVLRYYMKTQQEMSINDLFAEVIVKSAEDPVKGLIAGLALWEKDSTAIQLHEYLLMDFQKILMMPADSAYALLQLREYLKPVELESDAEKAEISSDGRFIYGWMKNHNAFIYNISSGQIRYVKADLTIRDMEISVDASLLGLIYENDRVSVFDFEGIRQYDFQTTSNAVMNEKLVCFFPSDNGRLAGIKDNEVIIYDRSGRMIHELKGHSGKVNSVDISPDGRFITTASADKRSFIWNYNYLIKEYSIYDSLPGHTGEVWSCRFNKTGKYIITASEDSTIRIWDLNGHQINPRFNFPKTMARYRYNNKEKDEDTSNPVYAKFYGKFCDASFSPGELEIVASGYINDNDSASVERHNYYRVLFYSGISGLPYGYERTHFLLQAEPVRSLPVTISELTISPDEKLAAIISGQSTEISVITGTGKVIKTFTGKNPMFSGKTKDFFWTDGNKICKFPVQPVEIKRIVNQFGIVSVASQARIDLIEI